jgi:retron-type reverse transcriptase
MKATPICHKHVLKEWLKSGYIYKNKLHKTEEGILLGGIITPMLCNLTLNGLCNVIKLTLLDMLKIWLLLVKI